MILQDILCTIKDRMIDTGYFSVFYEYVEHVRVYSKEYPSGKAKYPRYYLENGQYKNVYDFDVNGSGYVRRTYGVDITQENIMTTSCELPFLKLRYPMRVVAGVPKIDDSNFSDDRLAYELIEVLSTDITNIASVHDVETKITGYETDRDKVWNAEIIGIDHLMNTKLSYIYVDFELLVTAKKDCLTDDCY